jgi:hypothetical protein
MIQFSKRFAFRNWPNKEIPLVAAGVYVVWDNNNLIYCGMSGREYEKALADKRKKYGLVIRLNSHASGRLSGDQFCVYIANRFVIPSLTSDDLSRFASGEYKLDTMTKTYIHQNLEYQYAVVQSSSDAYTLERKIRQGSEFNIKPILNPL